MNKKHTRRGFTLIELLVVVLIIGILAAVALPQYQKAVAKSRAAEVIQTLSTLERATELWSLEHGTPTQTVNLLEEGLIDFACSFNEDGDCYLKNYSYSAFAHKNTNRKDIVAVSTNANFRVIITSIWGLNGKNGWTRVCGYDDAISKAVCEYAQNSGWEAIEGYDY